MRESSSVYTSQAIQRLTVDSQSMFTHTPFCACIVDVEGSKTLEGNEFSVIENYIEIEEVNGRDGEYDATGFNVEGCGCV